MRKQNSKDEFQLLLSAGNCTQKEFNERLATKFLNLASESWRAETPTTCQGVETAISSSDGISHVRDVMSFDAPVPRDIFRNVIITSNLMLLYSS